MTDPPRTIQSPRVYRIGLSTVFLLVAAIASWLGYWSELKKTNFTLRQLPGLRNAARELVVVDSSSITVVKQHPEFYGEEKFLVYIPEERQYSIFLKLEDVESVLGQPSSVVSIPRGKHSIEMVQEQTPDGFVIKVLIDGKTAIEEMRAESWGPTSGASSTVLHSESTSFEPTKDLVLLAISFHSAGSGMISPDAKNGILIGITPEQGMQEK